LDVTKHDPRTWGTTGIWVVEPRDEAIARTPAFGQRFFQAAFREFTAVADRVYFLRWSEQPEDVYAVFDVPAGGAGVQIDPALEYIIVWVPADRRSTAIGVPIRYHPQWLISDD
jgi:hypothetical protein